MLRECGLSKDVVSDIKREREPSIRNISVIAKYLDTSTDYLLGLTDDPTPPKKVLTDEERLAAEIFKMTPEKKKQLWDYAEFLKTKGELSQELSDLVQDVADGLSQKPLVSD